MKQNALKWAASFGITIMDPDGWRVDGLSLYIPINEAEFKRRCAMSTITQTGDAHA